MGARLLHIRPSCLFLKQGAKNVSAFSLRAQLFFFSIRVYKCPALTENEEMNEQQIWPKEMEEKKEKLMHLYLKSTPRKRQISYMLFFFSEVFHPEVLQYTNKYYSQSLTQHNYFYIQQYICQGDTFRPSRSSSGPSRIQIQALFSVPALWDPTMQEH